MASPDPYLDAKVGVYGYPFGKDVAIQAVLTEYALLTLDGRGERVGKELPVPQFMEEIMETIQLAPQERIQDRVVEHIAASAKGADIILPVDIVWSCEFGEGGEINFATATA